LPNQKKILIITQYFPPEKGGRSSRVHGMVQFLKKNFSITVVAPPPTIPFGSFEKVNYLSHKEKFDDFILQRIWTYQPSKENPSFFQKLGYHLGFPILISFFLLTNLRKFSTVIISTHNNLFFLVVPLITLLGKRLIIDVGDLPIDTSIYKDSVTKHSFIKKILDNSQIKCWKKADLIITNSNVICKEIQKIVKNSEKIEYFPFNVDSNLFKKYDYPQEKKIIYTGHLDSAQNIEIFIETLELVVKEIPDLKFEVYGWGESEDKIKKLITEMKLEKNFKINKPVSKEEIPKILSKSLAGLIPLNIHESLRYAMPTKAFEYMSCSLPIFSYGSSEELKEIIKKSKAGVFVKSNDPQELARNLLDFIKDKNSLEQYATNGRKFIENETDYSHLINRI
jgi:glycosyltransferase involved in cell wall biosynthesis